MDTTKHNIRIRNNIGDEIFYLDRKSSYIGIGDTMPEYKLDVDGKLGIGTISPNSALHVNGSVAKAHRPVTGGIYPLGDDDYTVFCDGEDITVRLPNVADSDGRIYVIRNLHTTNPITVDILVVDGAIEGGPLSITLDPAVDGIKGITVQANATRNSWYIIATNNSW